MAFLPPKGRQSDFAHGNCLACWRDTGGAMRVLTIRYLRMLCLACGVDEVVCVKFSKFDHGVRLSHPLGAAVARLPKAQRGERRRRRGGAHPLGGPEPRSGCLT